ncbi:hypothetical protein [Sulfurimonas sp.]|uniref:hypothetical protein n=1 Tax=Sulfurimonas sp. TaxID=2022749 RepID=UPI002615E8BF|nr:hypothetical protein [Sulfurimonas sp.]
MKKVYALTIMHESEIDFQCLISEDGKYFRVQKDELDYETMINELLSNGYTSVKQVDTEKITHGDYVYEKAVYEEEHKEFHTPQEIYEALLEDGFDCKLESQDNFIDVLEFSIDGQDLGIEVITATNKMKITTAANYLFKAANNEDYEPVEREKSGSYSLVLSDTQTNSSIKESILHILNELKNMRIDAEKFFKKGHYYSFLMSFIDIASMRHLEILTLKVGKGENDKISLNKQQLLQIKQAVETIQTSKSFDYKKTQKDWLDAFEINDKQERKFKLHSFDGFKDEGQLRICYVESEELYRKIQEHSRDVINFRGHYISATRTVKIESATIVIEKSNNDKECS